MILFKQRRKIRVYIQDGPTIEGVLAARTRREYVLWAPRLLAEGGGADKKDVELSAHVEIPRERVLWYQVIG